MYVYVFCLNYYYLQLVIKKETLDISKVWRARESELSFLIPEFCSVSAYMPWPLEEPENTSNLIQQLNELLKTRGPNGNLLVHIISHAAK